MVSKGFSHIIYESNPLQNSGEGTHYFHFTDVETEAQRRLMNCLRPWVAEPGSGSISSHSKFSSLRQCRQKIAFLMGILPEQYAWNASYLGKSHKGLNSDRYLLKVHQMMKDVGPGTVGGLLLGKPCIYPSSGVRVMSTIANYYLSLMCSRFVSTTLLRSIQELNVSCSL